MNVSACLVTRGNVDMTPIVRSLPLDWEVLVWDNGAGELTVKETPFGRDPFKVYHGVQDLSVYGRYAAIEYASHDLIYVQDDDVIVSDPQAIVGALRVSGHPNGFQGYFEGGYMTDAVVCNMPQEFRPHYPDSALVGFGAAFHRDAPTSAFDKLRLSLSPSGMAKQGDFLRECDRAFTVLTPRVLVDVPKENREFASAPDRLWKQPDHAESSRRMTELARRVRDA